MRKNAPFRLWFRAKESNLKDQKRAGRSNFRALICESLEARRLLAADISQPILGMEPYSIGTAAEVSTSSDIRALLASSHTGLSESRVQSHDEQIANWGLSIAEGEDEPVDEGDDGPETASSLHVVPLTVSIDQSTDLSAGIAVANIELTGMEEASPEIRLVGDQASYFEVREEKLYFRSNTPLGELEQTEFKVTIQVWDTVTQDQLGNSHVFEMSIHSETSPTLLVGLRNSNPLEETNEAVVAFDVAELYVENGELEDFEISISGADAEYFSISENRLVFDHPGPIDFETKPEFNLVIELVNPLVNGGEPLSLTHRLPIVDVNEAPTSLAVVEPVESLPESTDVGAGVQVGVVDLQDDAIGQIELSLTGPDAGYFYFDAGRLMFKSAEPLSAAVKSSYAVTINAIDTSLENSESLTYDFELQIVAVQAENQPPSSVTIDILVPRLVETVSIEAILLAKVNIEDDGLGENTVSLPLDFSNRLEIIGDEIWTKAGVHWVGWDRDLQIPISVQDQSIESSLPVTANLELEFIKRPQIASMGGLTPEGIHSGVNEIVLNWSHEVEIDSDAIQLVRIDVPGEIELVDISSELVDGFTTTTIKFTGDMAPNGTLANGVYMLKIAAEGAQSVEDGVGNFADGRRFSVINESLLIAVEIDAPAVAFVGKPTPFDFNLEGILEAQLPDVSLEIDWGAGGEPEVISPEQLEFSRSHQFNQTGTFVVQARLRFEGEVIREDSFVLNVSPVGSLQEDWLSGYDIDRDNSISPLDVLTLVNFINQRESLDAEFPAIYDINRDGVFSPTDILAIINTINRQELGSANSLITEVEMDQSAAVPGFTASPNVSGKTQLDGELLFASLDFSVPREITHLIQEDGTFLLSADEIESLFGPVGSADHTLSLLVFDGRDFIHGVDKRFSVQTPVLNDYEIETAVVNAGNLFLEWGNAGQAKYSVIVSPGNGGSVQRFENISNHSALVPLGLGDFEVTIEAIDSLGNVKATESVAVSRT